jgi:hypothetical protein
MDKYKEFEEEVLTRSKKIRFDGEEPFVGLSTPDITLNDDYFKILFNSIMHKIVTFKRHMELTYSEYEHYFNRYITEDKNGMQKSFYYDGELIAIVDIEKFKGVNRYIITPKDKNIIEEDSIIIEKVRNRRRNKE